MNDDLYNDDIPQDPPKGSDFLGSLFGGLMGGSKNIVNEAMENDKRIENAAMYKMSAGYTKMPKIDSSVLDPHCNPEVMKKAMQQRVDFQKELRVLFRDFKSAIKRKSYTIDELEQMIYSEYGSVKETEPIENLGKLSFMSEADYKIMRESYSHE